MLESLSKYTDVKEVNLNKEERLASLAAGTVLLIYAIIRIPVSAVLAVAAAAYFFFRGIRGFCYLYERLGMNRAAELHFDYEMKRNHKQKTAVPLR